MNKPGLEIKNSVIKVNPETKDRRQLSFCIEIENIIVVSVLTQIELDDDELYILLVDKDWKVYHLYINYFTSDFLDLLKSKFEYIYDYKKISLESFERRLSTIVFPNFLKDKNLYVRKIGLKSSSAFLARHMFLMHPASGIISPEIKRLYYQFY